jgi:hypothetical protein
MSKLEWNNRAGQYETILDDGYEFVVTGDEMSEEQDAYSREKFGVSYADADDEQTAIIDEELSDPYVWVDRQIKYASE